MSARLQLTIVTQPKSTTFLKLHSLKSYIFASKCDIWIFSQVFKFWFLSILLNVSVCWFRVSALVPSLTWQPCRNLTYFSLKKGKRKSVSAVTDRFMRLHCGLWIRRKAGYKKKLWKKLPARRKRLREIVFCNKTQCKLLDKMTSSYWKRRNWFLNDPYQKYHDRVNL
uniref:Large ribosomal subunit protein bL35m n=1 Tax=Poecilia reticulata TaxID=8081 RepID=A0A3P9PJF4_POERE